MSTSKWVVVGRDGCSYCDLALGKLAEHGYAYEYFKISKAENTDLFRFIISSGLNTLPQVYLNGQRLGGYDELKSYLKLTRIECSTTSPSAHN